MKEEWKPVEFGDGKYDVSNTGRVRNNRTGQDATQRISPSGLAVVALYYNRKHTTVSVPRLVAQSFLPNPEGLPIVTHIDDDPMNNHVDNLKWIPYKDIAVRGTNKEINVLDLARGPAKQYLETVQRPVIVVMPDGKEKRVESIAEAARFLHVPQGNAYACVSGKTAHVKGYRLYYADVDDESYKARQLGKPIHRPKRKVAVTNKETGEKNIFDTEMAAAEFTGLCNSSIGKIARGKQRSPKYIVEFVDE